MAGPRKPTSAYLQLVAVSWNFGWPVVAGVVLGSWLDDRLRTSPGIALVLGIGSLAVAAWRLIQLSRREETERQKEEDDEDRRP